MSKKFDANDALIAGVLSLDNAIEITASGKPNRVTRHGGWISNLGSRKGVSWTRTAPPEPRYLLNTQLKVSNWSAEEPHGVLRMGRIGMLAAVGGAGKTWALTQLAVSVATGRPWLDTFDVADPGHVFLALGEEDEEEVWRRVHRVVHALRLTDAEADLVEERIFVLPWTGEPTAMAYSADEQRTLGLPPEACATPLFHDVLQHARTAGVDWKLMVLDPNSCFAPADAETSNSAAARYVQTMNALTAVPGRPAVLLAHHTNKVARNGNSDATAARGSSALTDGVRWQAVLEPLPRVRSAQMGMQDLLSLSVVKSNYTWFPPKLLLTRDRDQGGVLRPATSAEIERYEQIKEQAKVEESVSRKMTTAQAKALATKELEQKLAAADEKGEF